MAERKNLIKMKGNPLTLIGNEVKVGDTAPDFQVIDQNMEYVKFSSFRGKVVVLTSVASIDTSTCDTETRRFNQEAGKFGDDVMVLAVSMDLPFAQNRWCGAAGIENVKMFSDYKDASFGNAFGVLIKELRLLARTVHIIDREGKVRYVQYVSETSEEPNYEEVLEALKKVV